MRAALRSPHETVTDHEGSASQRSIWGLCLERGANLLCKTGRKAEALDALAASLRLNPEQKDVEALRGRVEKELK